MTVSSSSVNNTNHSYFVPVIGKHFAKNQFFFSVPDNRCFLESGGSAESFFVSEDQPVGAVIGKFKLCLLSNIFISCSLCLIYVIKKLYKSKLCLSILCDG